MKICCDSCCSRNYMTEIKRQCVIMYERHTVIVKKVRFLLKNYLQEFVIIYYLLNIIQYFGLRYFLCRKTEYKQK